MDGELTGVLIGALGVAVLWFLYSRYGNLAIDGSIDFGVAGKLFGSILAWFSNILPFVTLVSGIIIDIVNQNTGVKYSLPSIVAFSLMATIGIGSQLWGSYMGGLKLDSEESYGSFWCTIPGLERLESPYIPTAFLATSLIYVYFLTWAANTGASARRIGTVFGIVLASQLASYYIGGCSQSYASIAGPGGLLNVAIPIVLGGIIGAITAGIAIAADKGHYNPFTPTSNDGTGGGGGGGGGGIYGTCPSGKQETASGDKCVTCPSSCTVVGEKCVCNDPAIQPPPPNTPTNKPGLLAGHSQPVQGGGDENTFVAELYKNGQLVTSTLAD